MPFYHFDVYRIGDIEEMEEIGYDDYFYGNGICLIEWANLIEEILPEQIIEITIEKNLEKGFDYRKITFTGLLEPGWTIIPAIITPHFACAFHRIQLP